jgi:hypothetical protein
MSYSKETRHKIYKKLLTRVCKDPAVRRGICNYLGIKSINYFPELSRHKPIKGFCSWQEDGEKSIYNGAYYAPCTYKGWETRISWIVKAIKDTK